VIAVTPLARLLEEMAAAQDVVELHDVSRRARQFLKTLSDNEYDHAAARLSDAFIEKKQQLTEPPNASP
jgi:hypothetical protein